MRLWRESRRVVFVDTFHRRMWMWMLLAAGKAGNAFWAAWEGFDSKRHTSPAHFVPGITRTVYVQECA